jgi:antitoxin component of RelBE/YafQ-DinJ toxin-antitoxin module
MNTPYDILASQVIARARESGLPVDGNYPSAQGREEVRQALSDVMVGKLLIVRRTTDDYTLEVR